MEWKKSSLRASEKLILAMLAFATASCSGGLGALPASEEFGYEVVTELEPKTYGYAVADHVTVFFDQTEQLQLFDHSTANITVAPAPCRVDAGVFWETTLVIGCYDNDRSGLFFSKDLGLSWSELPQLDCQNHAMVTDLRVWKGRLFASTGGCGAHSYGFQPALGMGDGSWSVVTTEFTHSAFDAGDELLLIDYRGGYVNSVGKNGIITRLADIPGAYRAFHHAGLVWITSITDNAVFQLDGQRFPIGGAFERTDEAMYLNSGCSVDGAIHVSDRHGSRILISRDGSSFSPSALPDSFAPTLWICDHPLGPLLVIQGNGALIRPAAALSEQPTG